MNDVPTPVPTPLPLPATAHDAPSGHHAETTIPHMTSTVATAQTRRALLRRAALRIAGLGIISLAAACGSSDAEDGEDRGRSGDETPVSGVTEVSVRDNYFEPESITVPAGATVTWRWEGKHDHNVVADAFASEVQKVGSFVHTFSETGRYEYRCTLHGGMDGEVVVTAADAAP